MPQSSGDTAFSGYLPDVYDSYLVPMLFDPYAADLAARVAARRPARVLEVAAGTGALTRHLARLLPDDTTIVATDLNQPMLDRAAAIGTSRPVTWRQADAMRLPLPDGSVDAVVCQFGVMFFPDRVKALGEFLRVLAPGGTLTFSTWDRIEESEFADTVERAMAALFPDDPPDFLRRLPHGYTDPVAVARDVAAAGFPGTPDIAAVVLDSHADSPRTVAVAFCEGTPLRNAIEAHDPGLLDAATDATTAALTARFGAGPLSGRMRAYVFSVGR